MERGGGKGAKTDAENEESDGEKCEANKRRRQKEMGVILRRLINRDNLKREKERSNPQPMKEILP